MKGSSQEHPGWTGEDRLLRGEAGKNAETAKPIWAGGLGGPRENLRGCRVTQLQMLLRGASLMCLGPGAPRTDLIGVQWTSALRPQDPHPNSESPDDFCSESKGSQAAFLSVSSTPVGVAGVGPPPGPPGSHQLGSAPWPSPWLENAASTAQADLGSCGLEPL